jgi:sugar/nucleoside kinase (ribokinase family)
LIAIPGRVLCCGNVVQDILVRGVEGLCFDTTTWVDEIELSLGGNGANTSYAMAMLGGEVRLLGYVGADEFGDSVIAKLTGVGVDVSRMKRLESFRTATTVGLVNKRGGRAFLHQPGVSGEAFPEPLEFAPDLIEGCSHFHLGNPFALPALRSHAGEVVAGARKAGLTVSMDTGWDARGKWLEVAGPCLPSLDLLFVNEQEAEMLSGHAEPVKAAQFFIDRGAGAVVVKLGAEGSLIYEKGSEVHVPAFEVKAVDSTGAGDCFAGAFLAGLHHGMDAEGAARLANAAGALSVSKLGAVSGLRDFDATLAWIEER